MGSRPNSESIKNISKTYQKRIMGSIPNSESIKNISKSYQKRVMVSRRNSDSIENISKTYHGVDTDLREYQKHMKHIQINVSLGPKLI